MRPVQRDEGPWQGTVAAWYGDTPHGCYDRGGTFTPHDGSVVFTAHKTLPCGTLIEVRYGARRIVVAVRDRGPYGDARRDLDLSRAAFQALAPLSVGILKVEWRVVPA